MNTELIYNFLSHSEENLNKNGTSSVFNALPYKITWEYNGIMHFLENKNKLLPLLLNDKKHIAVIEAPYNNVFNKALIIDGNGNVIWCITTLLKEQIKDSNIIFYDVYYIKDILYFFVAISNNDYRFQFNPISGEMGKLIESK